MNFGGFYSLSPWGQMLNRVLGVGSATPSPHGGRGRCLHHHASIKSVPLNTMTSNGCPRHSERRTLVQSEESTQCELIPPALACSRLDRPYPTNGFTAFSTLTTKYRHPEYSDTKVPSR
jgi:hypothetical protein